MNETSAEIRALVSWRGKYGDAGGESSKRTQPDKAPRPHTLEASRRLWLAHIGIDRFLGYGLRFPQIRAVTHLGIKGPPQKSPGHTIP
jgi:hypothetical protein